MRLVVSVIGLSCVLFAVGCASQDRKFVIVRAPKSSGFEKEVFAINANVPSEGWFLTGEFFDGSGNSFLYSDYTTGATYGTQITPPMTYSVTVPSQFHVKSGSGGYDYHVLLWPKSGMSASMQLSSLTSAATFGGEYDFIYITGNWPVVNTPHTTAGASGCTVLIMGRTDPVTTARYDQVFLLRTPMLGGGVNISHFGDSTRYLLDDIRQYVEVKTTTPTTQFLISGLPALDQEAFSKAEGLSLSISYGP